MDKDQEEFNRLYPTVEDKVRYYDRYVNNLKRQHTTCWKELTTAQKTREMMTGHDPTTFQRRINSQVDFRSES